MNVLKHAIEEPFKQIIKNGSKSPDAILHKIKESKHNIGYNSRTNETGDMFDQGVLDPHKVVRCALQNAVSAATMLLSVDCCMIDYDN